MEYVIHILIVILIYAILAQSIDLLIGHTGIFAVCQAAFFGVGSYTAALMALHLGANFLVASVGGALVAALLGTLIAVPSFRVKGDYMVIASFGFQILLFIVFLNWESVTNGPRGLPGIPRPAVLGYRLTTTASVLYGYLAIFGLCMLAIWLCIRSPYGRLLKAIRENETAALALGKNVMMTRISIFAFSAGLAGVAGSLYGHYFTFIDPYMFTLEETVFILTLALVGGAGTFTGPVVGALILVSIPEMLRFLDLPSTIVGNLRQIIYGVLLVAFVVFLPEGIMGAGKRRRRTAEPPPLVVGPEPTGASAVIQAPRPNPSDGVVLQIRDLFKHFGGIKAIDDLSLSLKEGRITALVGPNGAGKTTLFNLVTGLLPRDGGRVIFMGQDVTGRKPFGIARAGLGRTFQDLKLFLKLTVLDNVRLARARGVGEGLAEAIFRPWHVRAREAEVTRESLEILRDMGLLHQRDERAENLSYAEQKMLALARLLAMEARVLLLDEPTSGLDPSSIEYMLATIKRLRDQGRTICIVEHNLDVVREIANWIVFLDQGRVIADDEASVVLADTRLAEIYFGT